MGSNGGEGAPGSASPYAAAGGGGAATTGPPYSKAGRLVEMVYSLTSDLQQSHNLQEIQVHMEVELPHHLVVDGLVVEQEVVLIQHQVDLLEVVMVVVQKVDMFHGQIMDQVILWKTLVEVDLEHLEIQKEGSGGSGICIVRYTIAEVAENVAKATGNITLLGGKTYHALFHSAVFNVTSVIPSWKFY